MQRTLPPPTRSIVAMSAVTSRPCRSSARRVGAASERSAAADNAMTGPLAPSSSSRLPAKLLELVHRQVDELAARRLEPRDDALRSRSVGDRGRAQRREARAERQHDVRVIDRRARRRRRP